MSNVILSGRLENCRCPDRFGPANDALKNIIQVRVQIVGTYVRRKAFKARAFKYLTKKNIQVQTRILEESVFKYF